MSALNLLMSTGSLRGVELCPHPERLQSCAIRISAKRPMVVCPSCSDMFTELIARFHAREIGGGEVAAAMQLAGYTRGDSARFVLQLMVDRLKLRAGLLKEADL